MSKRVRSAFVVILSNRVNPNTTSVDGVFATGEVIFFRKYAIDELKFSEDDLSQVEVFIVDEREVLGVVRPLEVKVDNTLEVRRESKHADDKLRDSVK